MQRGAPPKGAWAAVLAVIGSFFVLQLATLDYGTLINDYPHIKSAQIDLSALTDTAASRKTVVGESLDASHENIDRWLLRYKLYSIEADEMVNIMALSRIKPHAGQFDPGFYQYGGAWLYPLGGWLFGLGKIGILSLGPLEDMLREPDKMDAVYFWGRFFVLFAVCLSAVVLFLTLSMMTQPGSAVLLTAIYLFVPSTIMYGQVMKPHWFGLLWSVSAIFLTVRAMRHGAMTVRSDLGLGLFLGLAVGTSIPYGLMAAFIWFFMAGMGLKGNFTIRSLFLVPTVSMISWFATNPYFFINRGAAEKEATAVVGWFSADFGIGSFIAFIKNSAISGYGLGLSLLVVAAMASAFTGRSSKGSVPLAIAIAGTIFFVSGITAGSMSEWHTNYRYAVYLLPGLLIVSALSPITSNKAALSAVLFATLVQATPLKLAYFDENDPEHSTRMKAAAWVDKNISAAQHLCFGTKTPAPYDVPPINFSRHSISQENCEFRVLVERDSNSQLDPERWTLVKRFSPRYSPASFPLVFEHINPQISVYRRNG